MQKKTTTLPTNMMHLLTGLLETELKELNARKAEIMALLQEIRVEKAPTKEKARTVKMKHVSDEYRKGLLETIYNTLVNAQRPLTANEIVEKVNKVYNNRGKKKAKLRGSVSSLLNMYTRHSSPKKGIQFERVRHENIFIYSVKQDVSQEIQHTA